jgi:hypothetical protein
MYECCMYSCLRAFCVVCTPVCLSLCIALRSYSPFVFGEIWLLRVRVLKLGFAKSEGNPSCCGGFLCGF